MGFCRQEYWSGVPKALLAIKPTPSIRASLMAQMVKNPPAMQETWVRSLGWEDPLEKGLVNHSSVLA